MKRNILLAIIITIISVVISTDIVLAATSKCLLTTGKSYKYKGGSIVYYITPKCTKQIVSGPDTFLFYFKSWQALRITTKNILNKIPNDKNKILSYKSNKKSVQNINQTTNVCINNQQCSNNQKCVNSKCINLQIENIYAGHIQDLRISKFNDSMIASQVNNGINSIIYSNDHGKTWGVSSGIDSMLLPKFTFDNFIPDLVYAASGSKTYQSTDGGKNFVQVGSLSNDQNFSVASILADNFVSGRIYIGHHNVGDIWGLYISNDGGKTFNFSSIKGFASNNVPEILKNRIMWNIAQDPQNKDILYTSFEQATHFAYNRNSEGGLMAPSYDDYYIMRTLDGGKTWQPISNGLPWHSIILRPFIDNGTNTTKWLAGNEGTGLYILDENSKSWSKITDGNYTDYAISLSNPKIHFSAGMVRVSMSKDQGKKWFDLLADSNDNKHRYTAVSLDSKGDLFVADFETGIIKISDVINL